MSAMGSCDTQVLGAGVLRCVLDGADIRDLTVGGTRVLTRLYIAVRDEKWNTIPFSRVVQTLESDPDHFLVRLSCAVDVPPVKAEWVVEISGRSAGEFRYSMSGRALSHFRYAKIGLNLHHPLPESLGTRFIARRGAAETLGIIPSLIEPQFFIEGKLTGMFPPYSELVLQHSADDRIAFAFSGDEFEMQDHRNWTDYNLKSYGTPLEVPLPLEAEPGQRIDQAVTIDLRGARALGGAPRQPAPSPLRLPLDLTRVGRLPCLGTEYPDELSSVVEPAAARVKELGLAHVRLNVDFTTADGAEIGEIRAREIASWNTPIELVAMVSTGEPRAEEVARLREFGQSLRTQIIRVAIIEAPRGFLIGRTATAGSKVRRYREAVEEGAGPVGLISATEQFFAELNRAWPDLEGLDGVGYTLCPQVHAADDVSLMENSFGQADTVATARARSGGRPVHVTSVVLLGKFGPYPGGVPDTPALPAYGDPRQYTTFAATWTLSSLRQLSDAEAASVTYFELFGDRGLVRLVDGELVVSPAFLVIEAAISWSGGNLVRIGGDCGPVVGLGAKWADRGEFLVANVTPEPRRIELDGLPGAPIEIAELCQDHGSGQARWESRTGLDGAQSSAGTLAALLDPYGVLRVRTR